MMETRRATLADAQLLFDLRNLESNRSMFKDAREIEWEEHIAWLGRKFREELFVIYIGVLHGKAIGQFRVQGDGDVSVSLFDEFKGMGLGWQLIKSGTQKYQADFPRELYAVVKSENRASAKAFEKAGFLFLETFEEGGCLYKKYIFTKSE